MISSLALTRARSQNRCSSFLRSKEKFTKDTTVTNGGLRQECKSGSSPQPYQKSDNPSEVACSRVDAFCDGPMHEYLTSKAVQICSDQIIARKTLSSKASSSAIMLRPCLPRAGSLLKPFRRGLRTLPRLSHDFEAGVPGLLSPAGFDMAWTQHQSLMIQKLDNLTVGTSICLVGNPLVVCSD